jgi:hypothetical protein
LIRSFCIILGIFAVVCRPVGALLVPGPLDNGPSAAGTRQDCIEEALCGHGSHAELSRGRQCGIWHVDFRLFTTNAGNTRRGSTGSKLILAVSAISWRGTSDILREMRIYRGWGLRQEVRDGTVRVAVSSDEDRPWFVWACRKLLKM